MLDDLPAPAIWYVMSVMVFFLKASPPLRKEHSLSTWEEPARFWELRPRLSFRTDVPCHCGNPEYDQTKDGRVCFPIRWLCVPTSGWRPDVLGVAASPGMSISSLSGWLRRPSWVTHATFPPPPIFAGMIWPVIKEV